MKKQFLADLEIGKRAEAIVKEVFSNLTNDYSFEDVSNQPEYYQKGDIIATARDGRKIFIEVKNDSRIAETYNILCEDEVYFKEGGYSNIGFMHSDYQVFCVVSEQARRIYVIDFKILKEIYTKGEFRRFNHPDQYTDGYLVGLYLIKRYNGLIDVIEY